MKIYRLAAYFDIGHGNGSYSLWAISNGILYSTELFSKGDEKFGYDHSRLLTDHSARWIVNLYFFKQLEDILNAE